MESWFWSFLVTRRLCLFGLQRREFLYIILCPRLISITKNTSFILSFTISGNDFKNMIINNYFNLSNPCQSGKAEYLSWEQKGRLNNPKCKNKIRIRQLIHISWKKTHFLTASMNGSKDPLPSNYYRSGFWYWFCWFRLRCWLLLSGNGRMWEMRRFRKWVLNGETGTLWADLF